MKPATLLLAASLVANIALIAVFVTRSADLGASSPPTGASRSTSSTSSAAPKAAPSTDASAKASNASPSDDARDLALGRAFARLVQTAGAEAGAKDGRWWRGKSSGLSREQELAAQRELSDALIAAFGHDPLFGGDSDTKLAFLSSNKRTALRRITQDYDEMMAKFTAGGVQLASDKEKLKLLRAERDRDIAALLTPSELADYELRTSSSAAAVRSRYGDAIASEDDFKKLFALQKAYDEKFPADALTGRLTPETMRARSEAQQQLQADIRAAVGDESYAALRRATDSELRTLDSLVSRLGLPANTTDRVATARETYAAESQRINADTTLTPTDRRAQLQALATKAKSDLNSTLGTEVADAFAPRASWVGMLQNGLAFSTTPNANTPGGLSLAGNTHSVYPIIPARVAGAPGERQVINFVSSTSDGASNAPTGGALFLGGTAGPGDPTATRNVQMISVNSTSTTAPTTPDATPTTTTVTPAPTPAPKP